MQMVGYGFYMGVPERAEARGLAGTCLGTAIGQVILLIIAIALLFYMVSSAFGGGFGPGPGGPLGFLAGMGLMFCAVYVIMAVLAVTELACSLFFLKACATTVRADGAASSINIQIIIGGVILLLMVAITVLFFLLVGTASSGGFRPGNADAAAGMAAMMGLCSCLTAVLIVGWGVWYIVTHFIMLFVLNDAIRRY
jgi:hypothetical protein